MTELAITIKGKDSISRMVSGLGRRFKGLTAGLKGVKAAAKGVTTALKGIAAAASAAFAPLALLASGAGLLLFLDRAKEESNDFGREMARFAEIIGRVARIVGDILAPVLSLIVDELEKIIPAATEAGDVLNTEFVQKLIKTAEDALRWGINITTELAKGLIEGARIAIKAAMDFIGGMLGFFLAPGSAPRILPRLAEWAIGTMEFYLKKFSEADFGILEGIQGRLEGVLNLAGKGGLFADVSQQIAQAISTGKGFTQVLDRLRQVGGKFGNALASLAQRHFDVAKAAKAVEDAERRIEESRKATGEATGKIAALRTEFARLKKEGADPAILKAKEAEIDAAQRQLMQSKQAGTAAEKDLAQAEKKRTAAEKQLRLQDRLVAQLTRLEQVEQRIGKAASAIGAAIAKGISSGLGGFKPAGADFEAMKARIKAKLKDLFKPVVQLWRKTIKPFLEDFRKLWKTNITDVIGDRTFADIVEEIFGEDGTVFGVLDSFKSWVTDTLVPDLTTAFVDELLSIDIRAAIARNFEGVFGAGATQGALVGVLGTFTGWLPIWIGGVTALFVQGAKDWIDGLIDGIESKLAEARGAVEALARALLDAWDDFWQTGSPSRIAAERMGKPIGQGILAGIGNTLAGPAMASQTRITNNAFGQNVFNIFDREAAAAMIDRERRRELSALGAFG